MTLLSRLLRQPSTLPPKTLDETIADLHTQSPEVIASVALSDDEQTLRIAAIAKLDVGDALLTLASLKDAKSANAVQRAAQQRVAQLLDSGAIEFSVLCRQLSDTSTILSVAALCSDAAHLQQTIASIDDSELLCKLAIDGASTKIRQLAAEAIRDAVQLKRMLKDARGKDKNVYKIIKQKCDALHAEEKAEAEKQAAINALCLALERLRHQPFDNLFAPTLEHLNTQWTDVAAQASLDQQTRAELAINRCREIIAQHAEAIAAQAAYADAIANADANRCVVLNALRSVLTAIYTNEQTENADRQVSDYTDRWAEIASRKPASPGDQTTFTHLCKAIKELTTLIAQHRALSQQAEQFRNAAPDADLAAQSLALRKTLIFSGLLGDAAPAIVTEAAAILHAWEQSHAEKRAAEANALRQLGGLIRKASGMLSDGKTAPVARMRRVIGEQLGELPSVPPYLTTQLQQLDEKLSLLQDWRSYAVAPKRSELIEQMEALIGSEEAPQALADQIKRLQDEWKSISKGSTENTDAEWQRFHQAAQTAYQPCREYFAAQAKLRDDNLDKRKALLTRLSDFAAALSPEQADWREVARALRESKQQWREHYLVERAANKPLQERFDALTNDLQSRLEAEYIKNVEEKKSLIARVQRLVTSEDSRQAIDEVKQLQLAWKNIGIAARDDEQKLWVEFREHCDAVFAKRQQQHSEYLATLEETRSKAVALCEEAEQLLTLSGPELLEGAKKLSVLREIFDAIGELPKANARDLQTRFDRALERCEINVAQQRARDKAQAWDNLLSAGDKIRLYRLAAIENATDDERAELKQAAQAFIDGISHWPKGGLQAIKNELAKDGITDIAANEAALRTICVRAEILTDTPTPPADQQFRREYQVRRLMQGMGQARGSVKEELEAMVLEWIGVGVARSDVYAQLLERFSRCRKQQQKHQ